MPLTNKYQMYLMDLKSLPVEDRRKMSINATRLETYYLHILARSIETNFAVVRSYVPTFDSIS
jgi:hypothetical protein